MPIQPQPNVAPGPDVGVCYLGQPSCPDAIAWYRVAFRGGIDLREQADFESKKVGITLRFNETFAVNEIVHSTNPEDKRVYLRLADGHGWAFDDSAVYPSDPSVMRGHWQPVAQPPTPVAAAPPPAMPIQPAIADPYCNTSYGYQAMPYPVQEVIPGMGTYWDPSCAGQLQHCPTQQTARRWKRGKRGGAKRRPKAQQ